MYRPTYALLILALLFAQPARAEEFGASIVIPVTNRDITFPVPQDMCRVSTNSAAAGLFKVLGKMQERAGNRLLEILANCQELDAVLQKKSSGIDNYIMLVVPKDVDTVPDMPQAQWLAKMKPELEAGIGSPAIIRSADDTMASYGIKTNSSLGQLSQTEQGLIFPMRVAMPKKAIVGWGLVSSVRQRPVIIYYYAPEDKQKLLNERFKAYLHQLMWVNDPAAVNDAYKPLQMGLLAGLLAAVLGVGALLLRRK